MRTLEPWEILIPEIFDGRRYCVYHHYADGLLFYVGSGQIARAFEFEKTRRCPTWGEFSYNRKISVVIAGRFTDRNEARRREYRDIRFFRPCGNDTLEEGQTFGWREIECAGVRVATLIDRVTLVKCDPLGIEFPSVAAASNYLGVSRSAVYNSISGRYPEVRGFTFSRVERVR